MVTYDVFPEFIWDRFVQKPEPVKDELGNAGIESKSTVRNLGAMNLYIFMFMCLLISLLYKAIKSVLCP